MALVCCCRLLQYHPRRHKHRQSPKEDHPVPQGQLVVEPLAGAPFAVEADDDVEAVEADDVAEEQVLVEAPC